MSYTYPQAPQYNPALASQMYKPASYTPQNLWSAAIPQVRPVSSIEEVRASSIDFDGSVFYFPDIANKKIYTKSVNMDGTVAINLYELKEITTPTDQLMDSSYVTREEFEGAINQIKLMYEELLKVKEQEMAQAAAQPQFQF